MLQISDLHKSFSSHVLLDGVSLQMEPRERLGLVGRNGHGKSTLFRIILGEEEHDSGTLTFPKNYKVGHLEQHLKFTKPTILEEGCLGLPATEADDHYKVEAILFGLGFTQEDLSRAPQEFSGGFQIRLNLAKVLVSKPNLLLLDEPTNYLDIVSVRWLTQFLNAWPHEMIIISHDREFMDSVTTHTAAIHRQQIKRIKGPTHKLYTQIVEEEEIHEKTRANEEKKREKTQAYIDRFRAKASKAKGVQSKIKLLEKQPQLQKLDQIESLDFEFRYEPTHAKHLAQVSGVSFGYTDELLFSDFDLQISKNDRVAIIGKNGKGKSTLLNVLAEELKPTSGSIQMHPNTVLGYFGQTNINRLNLENTIEKEVSLTNPSLGRTVIRNICGTMMFSGDKAEKPISVLSGGEKSRVLLCKILARPSNLLFLDEPTNHLDMESIDALVESIQNYKGAVVVVTHSEMLLRKLGMTKLVVFQHNNIDVFPGDYDDFLDKVGWEEEAGRTKKKKPSQQKQDFASKKELQKEQRRVQKSMESLEKKIEKLEADFKAASQKLEAVDEKTDFNEIQKLSDLVVSIQEKIDENFEELSEQEAYLKTIHEA